MTSNSRLPGERSRPRRRGLKIFGGVMAAVVIGWLIYATVNILSPSQGQLQTQSDAVVSLAPQHARLPLAQQLVSEGVADTLVISYFAHDPMNHDPEASEDAVPLSAYCGSDPADGVICFTPEEDATIGEVAALADMAKEQSWSSLTVVTDEFHTFRTRFIFEQCLGDDLAVNVVFTELDLGLSERARYVVYENAAFLKAAWQTVTRC